MSKTVTAFAPATVANISCGFDIMGFALQGAGDIVTLTASDTSAGNEIILKGKYAPYVPSAFSRNSAGASIAAMIEYLGLKELNIQITLEKNLPVGSGLGSSASGAAAAVYALNKLLGEPLATKDLVPFAMEGERVACGTAHADNVAPSLLGGFVLIRSYDPLDIIPVSISNGLHCVVIYPHIEVKTSDARRVLRKDFPLSTVVRQSANTAALMTGLLTGDFNLVGRSMNDLLAEPRRTQLIPGFHKAKEVAMNAGAIGCGISGSGPSVFALCSPEVSAESVGPAMQQAFRSAGLSSDLLISPLMSPGASVINS